MRTRQQRFLDEDTHQARCRWMRCGPGLFHNFCLCTTALFLADNPAATAVIRSLILLGARREDRKSTRLNSSHVAISYAVFCLKKKKQKHTGTHLLAFKPSRSTLHRQRPSSALPHVPSVATFPPTTPRPTPPLSSLSTLPSAPV